MAAIAITLAATAQPFYPKFSHRGVTVLDGDWSFGFTDSFGDALRPFSPSSISTPNLETVPSAFDVAEPGVPGRRGVEDDQVVIGWARVNEFGDPLQHRRLVRARRVAGKFHVLVDLGREFAVGPLLVTAGQRDAVGLPVHAGHGSRAI